MESARRILTVSDPSSSNLRNQSSEWRIPLSDLSGIKLTAVNKMIIGVGDRASPKPDGAGKLFIDDIGVGHPVATNP